MSHPSFAVARRVFASAAFTLSLLGVLPTVAPAAAQKPYHVETKWKIGGEGGWDYLFAAPEQHRLYIAHGTKVDVVDTNNGKLLGAITGLTRCHGVAFSADGKTGFISDGGANNVVAFDPGNFQTLVKIPAGTNPDGILLEPSTNTIWAFNGGSKNATIIDAASRKAVGTVALPGKPEFPQADGHGTIFVNIEDTNTIERIDSKARKVTASWKLAGCESPSGLALDDAGMRLFSVCDGKKMAVTDAKTGKQLALPAVGEGPDAAGYDAKNKLAFSSNGESGTLTVIDAGKPGYPVLQTLSTQKGARTMAFDAGNGKIYAVTAAMGKPAPGATRPSAIPGSFTVLVIGRD